MKKIATAICLLMISSIIGQILFMPQIEAGTEGKRNTALVVSAIVLAVTPKKEMDSGSDQRHSPPSPRNDRHFPRSEHRQGRLKPPSNRLLPPRPQPPEQPRYSIQIQCSNCSRLRDEIKRIEVQLKHYKKALNDARTSRDKEYYQREVRRLEDDLSSLKDEFRQCQKRHERIVNLERELLVHWTNLKSAEKELRNLSPREEYRRRYLLDRISWTRSRIREVEKEISDLREEIRQCQEEHCHR